jgi:hypothetical protein
MVMRAEVLVAGIADQNGPGDELEGLPPGAATEAALAHIGQ